MTSSPALSLNAVSASYGATLAIANIAFDARDGQVMGLIGPNGAGKSTVLKACADLIPHTGTVHFWGKELVQVRAKVGYMPQVEEVDWDYPIDVESVVAMGRYPHRGWFKRLTSDDNEIVSEALDTVGMSEFKKRQISELSGGQRRRVFLARVLAQKPEIYLLDEPFAGVDVASAEVIMSVIRTLRDEGASVVVVHHDLGSVPQLCDAVTLINKHVIATGPVADVFIRENINTTFGLGI